MAESKVQEREKKRPRISEDEELEDSTVTLKLERSKYPEWVGTLDEKELIKIFDIGVAVKESITMNITGGKQYFDEILEQVQDTQEALEYKINEVVMPLTQCRQELQQLAGKPASKGAVGEIVVLSVLEEGLPQHTFEDVSGRGGCGDIRVTSPVSEQKYLVEVKTRKATVPASEILKFEENLRADKNLRVGILLSLDSGIARRAIHRKFEITYEDEQYFIYVPNARKEENLIVWSVLLADELAALDQGQGLNESQTRELLKLQQKFQANMEKSKRCRSRFISLQNLVTEMQEDLMPLLDIIEKAKNELNKALHQRGK